MRYFELKKSPLVAGARPSPTAFFDKSNTGVKLT